MDDRIVENEVRIERRFCGPPETGNGGIVCSILAGHCGSPVEVTLRRPAPLDRPLSVRAGDGAGHHALVDGDLVIAEGRPGQVTLDVPSPPTWAEARAATRHFEWAPHPFPHCFVCGPARDVGDGLRTFAGSVEGRAGLVVAAWQPHATFGDASGRVMDRFLWAALDCPGGLAALGGRTDPIVLGRFTGQIEGSVAVGERCLVMGWSIAQSGRKHEVGTAIVSASGQVCGRARATWIELDQTRAAA